MTTKQYCCSRDELSGDRGLLPREAIATAKFIKLFDSLFDVFNSRSPSNAKVYRRAMTPNCSHITFLQSALRKLDETKSLGPSSIQCIKGWKITITSLLSLWPELQRLGFAYLCTNKFNQDPLENFFGTVRGSCGNNTNPTSAGFEAAYAYCSVKQMEHNSKFNCSDDGEQMLMTMVAALLGTNTTHLGINNHQHPSV